MSRIDFQNVCKRYSPELPLTINKANLTIEQGEFCVFVGPSGCGKSTCCAWWRVLKTSPQVTC